MTHRTKVRISKQQRVLECCYISEQESYHNLTFTVTRKPRNDQNSLIRGKLYEIPISCSQIASDFETHLHRVIKQRFATNILGKQATETVTRGKTYINDRTAFLLFFDAVNEAVNFQNNMTVVKYTITLNLNLHIKSTNKRNSKRPSKTSKKKTPKYQSLDGTHGNHTTV